MDTLELQNVLRHCPNFEGVVPLDHLPDTTLPRPFGLIVNTDPCSLPGKHWVGIYLDTKHGYYFDSFAQDPPEAVHCFLLRNATEYFASERQVQSMWSDVCGSYCALFMYCISNNISFHKFLNIFTDTYDVNDLIVRNLIAKNAVWNRQHNRSVSVHKTNKSK